MDRSTARNTFCSFYREIRTPEEIMAERCHGQWVDYHARRRREREAAV